jgi:tetratricopeptide (TPR) repeat protein
MASPLLKALAESVKTRCHRILAAIRVARRLRFGPLLLCLAAAICRANAQPTNSAPAVDTNSLSRIIEAAGQVEYSSGAATNWHRATVGLALKPGDRVRTHAQSRAAVQLSDRSVIRLNERTTLELLPPRHAEKKRFALPGGSLFFFNREQPADVEFDTPLAAGAIRGTEFLLEVADTQRDLRLALIDGLVSLETRDGAVQLERGEDLRLQSGRPPQKTALVNATAAIQWALYYPAVVDPGTLQIDAGEQQLLSEVLQNYRAGDLLAALAAWPIAAPDRSEGARVLHAQLLLAVGQVFEAGNLLAGLPADAPAANALREIVSVVRGDAVSPAGITGDRSASESLAASYGFQARSDLPAARAAAKRAVERAPDFGFAHARLAELEFAFGNRRAALAELEVALRLSPRLAPAHSLRGFVLLDQGDTRSAFAAFDQARELDAAFGPAWVGRGLCLMRERQFNQARAAFQTAAALEPQRGLFRAYLGKAASEIGDEKGAKKEFNLAKRLDPNDPTAWLYSALDSWQDNRINEAIRELERSSDLNDERAPFRSRLLLDSDRSVRSADLAALYDDAGVPVVGQRSAARSVAEDYANFSGHLFLANSYQSLETANRFDLRLETARQSELLVANLLAPPGAGNLSQQLSQQEHLRFFDPRPVGVSTFTQYGSNGDWRQLGTVFGTVDGFSYAFDANYEDLNGQYPNNDSLQKQYIFTAKQRVTADDELYFQFGWLNSEAGDIASLYDPAQVNRGFRVSEEQEPTLSAGWHHTWAPGSHSLLLLSRLDDQFSSLNPRQDVIFLRQIGGITSEVIVPPPGPPITNDFDSRFTLYSAELQQIWETPQHSLVVGGRFQSGDVDSHATLSQQLTGTITDQRQHGTMERGDVYGYWTWRPFEPLQLIGGASYDHLKFPSDTDIPPLSGGESTRDQVSPKVGLMYTPWKRGVFRADYTKSLGGLFFDPSVRLEPTQVAGFNQAFRSLLPESVAGIVPGSEFQTAAAAFDQSFAKGTWFGVEAEWLKSDGARTVGVLTNSTFLPIADSPGSTRQTLDFQERNFSVYGAQLLGEMFSLSARYRWSEAKLRGQFPGVPDTAVNLDQLEQNNRAILQQVALGANVTHPSGVFAQWESVWYHQSNFGYTPALAGDDFWQHNVIVGYRFPRRSAEVQFGVLNLADTDYHLNPLNLHAELPRGRTIVASLRLNF